MTMLIIMNVIGIFTYFLIRYEERTDKTKPLSFTFWAKDNWAQLMIILLFDLAIMMLLLSADITIDTIPFVPEWFTSYGDATIAWFIGLILAQTFYVSIKKLRKL